MVDQRPVLFFQMLTYSTLPYEFLTANQYYVNRLIILHIVIMTKCHYATLVSPNHLIKFIFKYPIIGPKPNLFQLYV